MKPEGRGEQVHTWWKSAPGERYWLDVTERNGRDSLLASPRGEGRFARASTHRLLTHVRSGDVVFHFDAPSQAIVAWSICHGRVGKYSLAWPSSDAGSAETAPWRVRPSWGIELRRPRLLTRIVTLPEIARVQWDLFAALRELEDKVGDPLHYPFEMGRRDETRPLAGYVFKLPRLLVRNLPPLAMAADLAIRSESPRETVFSRMATAGARPHEAPHRPARASGS
jgi:hypothetical protein